MSPDDPLDPPEDDYADLEVVSTIRRRAPRAAAGRRAADLLPLPPAAAPRPALPEPAVPFPDPIPHILPHGSIATLSGASGVGKTAWIAGLIRGLQRGEPFFGHPTTTPAAIGYIAADRPWRDHAQWFTRADCAAFPYYSLRDDYAFNWNRFRDWKQCSAIFGECLDRLALPPGALVIVDPLPLFIPGRLIDYKDMGIGMAVLDAEGIRPRQLTMIGVFHVAKQKANKNDRYLRPQDRILGSGGQIGYSETALYLMSPEEMNQPYYEVGWVPHQIKGESHKLKRDDTGLFTTFDEYDDLGMLAVAMTIFEDGRVHAASIAYALIEKACGCSNATARRHAQRLLFEGRITRIGRGQYQLAGAQTATKNTAT